MIMLERIFLSSRYLILIAVLGAFSAALVLYIDAALIAVRGVVFAIEAALNDPAEVKKAAVGLMRVVDLFFIAIVFHIIAVGLYKLFIDENIKLPAAMQVEDFEALKKALVKLVVVILLILFLEKALDWQGDMAFLGFGAAIAMVIAAATWNLKLGGHKPGDK